MKRCRICRSINTRTFLKRKKDSLIKCQNCGVIFVWPFPTQKQIKKLYTQEHFTKVDPDDKNQSGYTLYLKEENLWQENILEQIKEILQYKNKGSFLDIGCGMGTLLLKAKQAGFDVYGLDVVDFSVKTCHKRGLKKVKKGSIDRVDKLFHNMKFDVIVVSHILEHVYSPQKLIKIVKECLKPKGLLFIAVPNSSSLTAKIMGRYWFGYWHYQHLFIFNYISLNKLLKSFNMQVLKSKNEGICWISTKNLLKRIKLYYSSFWINFLSQVFKKLLDLFKINKLPVLLGNMWYLVRKKNGKT